MLPNTMTPINLNGKTVWIDPTYKDELAQDTLWPFYDDLFELQGRLSIKFIKEHTTEIPPCYVKMYADALTKCRLDTTANLNSRLVTVLRLIVNNPTNIHYLVGPVDLEVLRNRESGQYFAFTTEVVNGLPVYVLYGAESGLELINNLKNGVSLDLNKSILILKDKYFVDAINQLNAMHVANNVCAQNELVSITKTPTTVIPAPGEEEKNHLPHCKWCISMGLNGRHETWHEGIGIN